jgi:hypothetical protein
MSTRRRRRPPGQPLSACTLPGSSERIERYQRRAEKHLPLHHPGDVLEDPRSCGPVQRIVGARLNHARPGEAVKQQSVPRVVGVLFEDV